MVPDFLPFVEREQIPAKSFDDLLSFGEEFFSRAITLDHRWDSSLLAVVPENSKKLERAAVGAPMLAVIA